MPQDFPVPGDGVDLATPMSVAMYALLGGESFEGVGFTRTQIEALDRFYGYHVETEPTFDQLDDAYEVHLRELNAKLAKANSEYDRRSIRRDIEDHVRRRPTPKDAEAIRALFQAGAGRNRFRYVRRDGLRVMAALSRYLEPGEDPVRLVLRLLIEAGYDVPDDADWVYGEDR